MHTKEEQNFQIFAHIFMILSCCFALLPIILLTVSSLTDDGVLIRNGYSFFPEKWSLNAYKYLFQQGSQILRSYGVSVFITIAGTILNITVTSLLAYPLSRKDMPGYNIFAFIIFFTMLFNGGLVPTYLMYTGVFHIKNTIWALLIPSLMMNAYYVMLMRSFFTTSIPFEIIESANIDGAGELTTFLRIVMPMSKPILATVVLFVGIAYWNDWNNGLIYLTTKTELFSIQNLLNRMMKEIEFLSTSAGQQGMSSNAISIPSTTVRMAIAVTGILPIAVVYPFLQKNFVKGITLGAVKG